MSTLYQRFLNVECPLGVPYSQVQVCKGLVITLILLCIEFSLSTCLAVLNGYIQLVSWITRAKENCQVSLEKLISQIDGTLVRKIRRVDHSWSMNGMEFPFL